MNPFNIMNQARGMSNSNMSYFRNIYQMLANSRDPIQVLNTMARSNPNMKPIIDLMNRGASPKDIFEDMCKQRGIDPKQFIEGLTR